MSRPSTADTPAQLDLEELAVNTIRVLSMDGVQKAKSGHPGLPMGCADFAFTLFTRFLSFNPTHPDWPNRDRFVLSAGHGSMLLYSLLHLCGYDLPMDELRNFRQWGSKTAGHPEYGEAPGIETTTGPLGQGFANGVGMALAERLLAERFNTPEHEVVNHHTYALVSDGDVMEGVAQEAASIAGHLKLGKLIYFYDSNSITIEGGTSLAFSEDVGKRFEAYGWHVLHVNGHDRGEIAGALEAARNETARPSLVIGTTTIAYGSPNKAGTSGAHGSPLGEEEVAATRENLGWKLEPFEVPEEVRPLFAAPGEEGARKNAQWDKIFADYCEKHPDRAGLWDRILGGELPANIALSLPTWNPDDKPLATRAASGAVINSLADDLPELIGGSADLAPSNNTMVKGQESISSANFAGRNLHFGIREHAMASIMNGMSLHGGIRPYGGTFLIFSDYCRPAMRLAALTHQPIIYVFTHDSVFLGEDGPTHQPIEHLASLRAMPNLNVFRPADANETAAGWLLALQRKDGPTALALTRQGLPNYDKTRYGQGVERGGYVLVEESGDAPDVILIASGSEVHICVEAAKTLEGEDVSTRVVSLPCWEIFQAQTERYRDSVLPPEVTKRVAVEAGSPLGWERYVGWEGKVIGLDRFGASAPLKVIAEKLGFTAENIAKVARELVG